jgi:hypothetical protein
VIPDRTRAVAGTAMVLAVLALGACGIPTASAPSPIAKADVPYHLLNPPTTTTTIPGAPPAVGVTELIYLVAPSGHLGSGGGRDFDVLAGDGEGNSGYPGLLGDGVGDLGDSQGLVRTDHLDRVGGETDDGDAAGRSYGDLGAGAIEK